MNYVVSLCLQTFIATLNVKLYSELIHHTLIEPHTVHSDIVKDNRLPSTQYILLFCTAQPHTFITPPSLSGLPDFVNKRVTNLTYPFLSVFCINEEFLSLRIVTE